MGKSEQGLGTPQDPAACYRASHPEGPEGVTEGALSPRLWRSTLALSRHTSCCPPTSHLRILPSWHSSWSWATDVNKSVQIPLSRTFFSLGEQTGDKQASSAWAAVCYSGDRLAVAATAGRGRPPQSCHVPASRPPAAPQDSQGPQFLHELTLPTSPTRSSAISLSGTPCALLPQSLMSQPPLLPPWPEWRLLQEDLPDALAWIWNLHGAVTHSCTFPAPSLITLDWGHLFVGDEVASIQIP